MKSNARLPMPTSQTQSSSEPSSEKLRALLEEQRLRKASRPLSLVEFTAEAWPIVEPATDYLHTWHVDLIAEHLEAVTAGEITRLIINIPPRNMKSISVSVMWPCWEWGPMRRPELRYLFCSYAATLSTKHSLDRRRIIESEWYRDLWPHVALTTDQNVKTEYENTRRGVMISTSVGGAATGKGGNRVVVDDPVNPEEAYSDAKREAANDYVDRTLPSRLDDKRRDAMVIVMQRIHDDDVTGHVLARSLPGEWTHLCVPAEAPEHMQVVFPRSGRVVVRDPGELLWPEREGPDELAAMKRAMGTRDYEAQFNQNPAPPEGAMIKTDWFRYWRELPDGLTEWLQSWDMTFTDSDSSDYVVGQCWAKLGADKYLVDQVRGRWDMPKTVERVRAFCVKWPQAGLRLVEDKANGPAVVATLKREIGGFVPVTPKGGKIARLAAVSPDIEGGNVYIPDPALNPWVEDYLFECSRFPFGAHDDQVDSTSQALQRLTKAQKVATSAQG